MRELLNYNTETYGGHPDYQELFDKIADGSLTSETAIDNWVTERNNAEVHN